MPLSKPPKSDRAPRSERPPKSERLGPNRAITRFSVSFGIGLFAAIFASLVHWAPALCSVVGWDVAASVLLAFSWFAIARADPISTHQRAGSEDPGRNLVYAFALGASVVSLFASAVLSHQAAATAPEHPEIVTGACFAAVFLSWALTHTLLTLRYAHLYYREDNEGVGGVDFPGGFAPAYFDFAYFAFTIGMCFQISDACVTSPQIRKTVLGHAVLSFAYNTVILAFTLNLVFGAMGKTAG